MANAAPCAAADAQTPITQIDFARAGVVTPQMAAVAAAEGREPEAVRAAVAAGRTAIPANIHHASLVPAGVGSTLEGVPLSTKVNVNLGISGDLADEARGMGEGGRGPGTGRRRHHGSFQLRQDPRLPPRAR